MHSTVTKLKLRRLSSITIKKQQLLLINQNIINYENFKQ